MLLLVEFPFLNELPESLPAALQAVFALVLLAHLDQLVDAPRTFAPCLDVPGAVRPLRLPCRGCLHRRRGFIILHRLDGRLLVHHIRDLASPFLVIAHICLSRLRLMVFFSVPAPRMRPLAGETSSGSGWGEPRRKFREVRPPAASPTMIRCAAAPFDAEFCDSIWSNYQGYTDQL